MLNAGGTIACDESGRFRILAGMRSEEECRRLFEDLPARFRILFNDRRLATPYQFTFRQIPGQGPQVSEDACPEYWNDILQGLEEIHDEHAQFLAGVIVLHGTDTMAYAAPLLYFRTVGVPYPIILTGANHPPSEPADTRLPDLGTDAWENIYTAAMFIATHGERFRGVFVSFAGRVLLPVNVRKRKTLSGASDPLLELGARRMDTVTREILGTKHIFHFDNVNLPVSYLARLVHGEFQFALPVAQAERLGARLSRARVRKAVFAQFGHVGSDSWFHKVSPAEPFFFADRYLRNPQKRQALEKELKEERVSVVVLGGYKSTTLPTEFGNGIRIFCELCKKLNITVLLTTRSGSGEPSQYSKTASLYLPQCKEMISETAVAAAFHVAEELRSRRETRETKGRAAPATAAQEMAKADLKAIDQRLVELRQYASGVVITPQMPSGGAPDTGSGGRGPAGALVARTAMGCGGPGEMLPDRSAESFRFGISVGLEVCQRMIAPRARSSYSLEDVPRHLEDIFERLGEEGFGQASVHAVPDFENETIEWRFVFRLPGGDCRAWGGAATDGKCSCYAWMWRGVLHAVLAELIWRVGERGRDRILRKIAGLSQESSLEFAQARLRALWFRRVWTEPSPVGEGMVSMIVQAPDVFGADALEACVPIL